MNDLTIVVWIIVLLILYFVIKWAIDRSETAENIREIREILSKQFQDGNTTEEQEEEPCELSDLPFDECPACHSKVLQKDIKCPSCGLSLKNINE